MAYDITDLNEIEIHITDGWREWYIPKFRINMVVSEPYIHLYWTDSEKGTSGIRRGLTMDYQDVTFGYISPSSAGEVETEINAMIVSAWSGSGGVQSVTGLNTDNTDPLNPVVQISVDGITILGSGTPGDPLVASASGGANLWAYRAKTSIITGNPTSDYMIWNSATQISSTQINLSHLTDDGFDIDLFFPFIVTGDKIVIQDRDDSTNFQIWTVSATVTIIPNSYVEIPVTLSSSGGTGTTNFANNLQLLVARFAAAVTPDVESVTALSNIPVKVDNSDPLNPVLDYEFAVSTETADFTLDLTQAWSFIETDTASSIKITVPANATVAFPIGTQMIITTLDAGLTYFEEAVGVTIHSKNDYLGIDGQHGVVRLTKFDTNVWYLDGDLRIALDADAEAYINAVGTFSNAEKGYINSWFLSAKANGYYSKYHAVYLFLGGSAAAHKWNAVDPQDTDAAFRMVFSGSPTHNANGVTWNGTTQYGDTKLVPSSVLSQNSKHYSAYMRTVGGGSQFGATNASTLGDMLHIDIGAVLYWNLGAAAFETGVVPATKTRFWQVNRDTSTTADLRRNDASVDTDATGTTVNVGVSVVLGARNSNGTINLFSADNICFFAIGDSFSSAEITAEYADVQTLQTDFGRNV